MKCPNCLLVLDGQPIPEKLRGAYGGREVAPVPIEADAFGLKKCPDCGHRWRVEERKP